MAINNQHRHTLFGGNVDWTTVLVWLLLCLIGWFNIYAAVYDPEHSGLFNLTTNYGKQSLFILSAIVVGLTILVIDAKFFASMSPVFYGITLLLLIAVLIIGRNVGGNQAWIPIGEFRLQPSEFAKLATCLLLAWYLSSQSNKTPNLRTLLIGASIVLVPVALVMLQPDAGSALAFGSLIFIFYREGYISSNFMIMVGLAILLFVLSLLFNEWWIILGMAVVLGIFFYFSSRRQRLLVPLVSLFLIASAYIFAVEFAYNNLLRPHHRSRIEVILGQIDDPRGEGYNLNQSKIAIGSGKLWGKGYLQGTQTKYNFVPEQSTDFIFCTIGEEWGFLGSTFVIAVFVTLMLRLIFIAERQRSTFTRIYGYSVACIFFMHVLINIGMAIGLAPVIGIPLPFFSYGGSSLWGFTLLLFILLKLDTERLVVLR
ncbi:MAG TPA: rod shape-determining protein RodA [Sphingobacteriaceae bacterium]|nr:rod shape-determining protein RodA [Sphingobacteriaceae bacterium]